MGRPVEAPVPPVDTADLRAALEHALRGHLGAPRRIFELERRPSAYGSSFTLEELDVRLDDGTALPIMFKNLSRRGLLEDARRVKPAFLHDAMREIDMYRVVLATSGLGTPTCYGAVVDQRAGRFWLFLEKVSGVELYQVGEFAIWQEAARWLAAMHTRLAGQRQKVTQARVPSLLTYDADFYRQWLGRARAFVRRGDPSRSGDARRDMEWLAECHDRVVERLMALPVTVIHGEFYASNVLVQETAGGLRVCPVDWEMAAVGPGLIDLAALTTGRWNEAERKALALAYHGALMDSDWRFTPDAFLAALDCCYLHLAIQWLGWSPEWSPPAEHAQNWLSEALRVAEKLQL
jgi:Ser/Thr protein kinase RdoA (MazF antagonist)